jgi:hypothetical protein
MRCRGRSPRRPGDHARVIANLYYVKVYPRTNHIRSISPTAPKCTCEARALPGTQIAILFDVRFCFALNLVNVTRF